MAESLGGFPGTTATGTLGVPVVVTATPTRSTGSPLLTVSLVAWPLATDAVTHLTPPVGGCPVQAGMVALATLLTVKTPVAPPTVSLEDGVSTRGAACGQVSVADPDST